jgi:hypothetical protein
MVFSKTAEAHEPLHSYIFLKIYENRINGRFEITAADLNKELGLNLNEEIVESEVMAALPIIHQFLLSKITFGSANAKYQLRFTETEVLALDDEADNIELHFELDNINEIPNVLEISYDTFFEKSPSHKGVIIIEHNWKAGIIDNHLKVADIFTEGDTVKQINLEDTSWWKGFVAMIKLGMWHIWIGLDHILFLVALILPSVVRRKSSNSQVELLESTNKIWAPVKKFKPAFLYILGIVTSFTIAHSITLAVASMGIINLPSRYVESIIALSIALAAFHNISLIFKAREWVIAFAFGLFHGFGFASVLGDKGLAGEFLSLSLIGFNVGVEIGQLLIVAGIFPILFLLRKLTIYPKILTYGSMFLILISLHWVIERFFEINIRLGRILDAFL